MTCVRFCSIKIAPVFCLLTIGECGDSHQNFHSTPPQSCICTSGMSAEAETIATPDRVHVGDIGEWIFSTNFGPKRVWHFKVIEQIDNKSVRVTSCGECCTMSTKDHTILTYRATATCKWLPKETTAKEFGKYNCIVWHKHHPHDLNEWN